MSTVSAGRSWPDDGDERRQVGAAARQVFRELEAGARRRGVGVDRVVEQAEAVVLAHALVLLPHVGDLAQVEREPHRVERGTPELTVGIAARNDQQAAASSAGDLVRW